MAAATEAPTREDARQNWYRMGVSQRSPMLQYGQGIDYGQQLANSLMARPIAQQQMQMEDASNLLAGQQAREQEAQQWAQYGLSGLGNQLQNNLSQQGGVMQLLAQLMGMWR